MDHNNENQEENGNDRDDAPEHLLTEAVNRFRQGEYSKALELFDQVISLDPDSTRAWNGRGAVLGKPGIFYRGP